MPPKKAAVNLDRQALADFRARLDRLDGAIHDLLRERAEIVDQVRVLKGKQHIYIRPGREAQMLRALAMRPQGKIPAGLTIRLWREIISGFTLIEGGLKVAVYAPESGLDLWDLARDHFGAFTPLHPVLTANAALEALRSDKATVAVIPLPDVEQAHPWWVDLITDNANTITVFASMPNEILKAGRGNARNSLPEGLIVGCLYPELTGDDRSFIGFQVSHVPEAEMKRLLGKAGYKVRKFLTHIPKKSRTESVLFLAEVEGFIGKADTRLGRLRAMLGSRLQHLALLGGYPVPVKQSSSRKA